MKWWPRRGACGGASRVGRVAGGGEAPGSHRSRRDSLPSTLLLERADPSPLSEQGRLACEQACPPSFEPFDGPQSFVLLRGPAPQVEVDALQEGIERGAVVPPVVAHPSGDDGVQPSRQIIERQAGLVMDPQFSEPLTFGFERLGADRRQERGEPLAAGPVLRPSLPELIAEKGEAGVLVLTPALIVLADRKSV